MNNILRTFPCIVSWQYTSNFMVDKDKITSLSFPAWYEKVTKWGNETWLYWSLELTPLATLIKVSTPPYVLQVTPVRLQWSMVNSLSHHTGQSYLPSLHRAALSLLFTRLVAATHYPGQNYLPSLQWPYLSPLLMFLFTQAVATIHYPGHSYLPSLQCP